MEAAAAEDAAVAVAVAATAPVTQQQQQQQQAQQSRDQPSGFVSESQVSQKQERRADELTDREEEEEEEGEVEREAAATEPAQPPTLEQEAESVPAEQEEAREEAQESQEPPSAPQREEEARPAAEESEEKEEKKQEEDPPRFEPPSPPREQPAATEPEQMSAPPRSSRYSYTELKEAQRRCEGKMVETALLECREASRAQQEIFRAHVTDLCANIFAAALRKYNPENKEALEPVDPEIAAKAAEAEKRLKAKEAEVHELRKQVPRMAAMLTRQHLVSERKRSADVLVTAPEMTDEVEMPDVDVEAMRDAFVKTSTTIANANAKLTQVISQTTETIHVVEQAMKRPKTSIDNAMEHSPLKTAALLTDQAMASDEHPSSMRTRLAMHLSASRNV